LVIGELTLVDNDLTIPSGVSWKINNVIYSIGTDTIINIPFADTDLNRKDIIIANEEGEIIRLAGTETAGGIVVAPILPANTLLITEVDVSDSTIGDPSDPVVGTSGFKGYWNADTNTPALVNGVGQAGDYLTVYVPGEQFSYNFGNLDRVEYNGSIWYKSVDNNQTPDLSNYYDKDEVDALIVGLWDDRGNYDASSNAYPSSGGSGNSGAILKGDIWTISVPGTFPTGQVVEIGDTVRALIDSPGNTQANWSIQQNNIGYVAENSANKATTMSGNTTSNVVYLSAKAIYDWAIGAFQAVLTDVNFGSFINGLTGKTTPVDVDYDIIMDSADSNKVKKVSFADRKATLKTYFDTQYSKVLGYMNFVSPNGSPTSGATYYLADGNIGLFSTFSTTHTNRRVSAMATGKLTKVHITVCAGLAATAPNNMSFVVENITAGTSQTITTSLALNSGIVSINTSINLAVTIDDQITLRWTMPAWGSPPTNVNVIANFTIES
jgi:hypothetical protein